LLPLFCDKNDPERAFVKFNENDDTVLLLNNYGGLSTLELGALTQETLSQLGKKSSFYLEMCLLMEPRKEMAN
jgi:dihydroxyacetone kinase